MPTDQPNKNNWLWLFKKPDVSGCCQLGQLTPSWTGISLEWKKLELKQLCSHQGSVTESSPVTGREEPNPREEVSVLKTCHIHPVYKNKMVPLHPQWLRPKILSVGLKLWVTYIAIQTWVRHRNAVSNNQWQKRNIWMTCNRICCTSEISQMPPGE